MMAMADKALEIYNKREKEIIKEKFQIFIQKRFDDCLKRVEIWENGVTDITSDEIGFINDFIREGKRLGFLISKTSEREIRIEIPEYVAGHMTMAQTMLHEFNSKLKVKIKQEIKDAQEISQEIFKRIEEGNFIMDRTTWKKYHMRISIYSKKTSTTKVFDEEIQKIMKENGFCKIKFFSGEWHLYINKP